MMTNLMLITNGLIHGTKMMPNIPENHRVISTPTTTSCLIGNPPHGLLTSLQVDEDGDAWIKQETAAYSKPVMDTVLLNTEQARALRDALNEAYPLEPEVDGRRQLTLDHRSMTDVYNTGMVACMAAIGTDYNKESTVTKIVNEPRLSPTAHACGEPTAGHSAEHGGLRGHSLGDTYPYMVVGVGDRWAVQNALTGKWSRFTWEIVQWAHDFAEWVKEDLELNKECCLTKAAPASSGITESQLFSELFSEREVQHAS